MKQHPADIIILHLCTTNDNHIMYGSWDMKCDKQKFFVILGHFLHFTPIATQKMKKWKKYIKISFYTSVPKIMIICYTVPDEIECNRWV